MAPRSRGRGAPMRVVDLALVVAAVVSIATGSAAAANYTQETLDRYFRIEYEVKPSAAARRQRLRVQHAPRAASRSHAARHRGPRRLRQGRRHLVDLDTWRCTSRQSRLLQRAGRDGRIVSGPS